MISLDRREFLATLAASTLLVPNLSFATSTTPSTARYFSARVSQDGRYFVSGFNGSSQHLFDTPLPTRGHGLAIHPTLNHVTAVARRPETYLIVINSETGEIIHHHESKEGRHFYGHSIYSTDGRWFYTTENDIEMGNGYIGVRDVSSGYKQVAEFSSYGIGPHELNLLSDGKTLVVANGGILTRPETGRRKLNLDTMLPSLTYIDATSGELLEEHHLPKALHRNSIRHFAVNANDEICIAMQYQGSASDRPPLVGMHRQGEKIQLIQAPEKVQEQMRNYCGSVCTDVSNHWFAVSSPKGNLVTFWSVKHREYVGSIEINDGCGIAAGNKNGEFILSSGVGGIYSYRVGHGQLEPLVEISKLDTRWDNHIARTM